MSAGVHDFSELRDYLYGLRNHGAKYGIDRMRLLVEQLGHPERAYPVVHVAGTNGKGSTVATMEAIFRAAGYRTGMFTSPHLVYQGERVQVDREILAHGEIVRYANKLIPIAEAMAAGDPDDHPSFFEFITAMAFLRFRDAGVDLALLETGLGGRLDATNVVRPELCVITSIGLDHTDLLGETLESIAAEKAGILKEGIPLVLGRLPEVAERVVRRRAAELGCPVHTIEERFGRDLARYPVSRLAGAYQRLNAATAVLAVEILGKRFDVPESALERGLATVEWAGRWDERELAGRRLILDATHNEEGSAFLRQNLARLVEDEGRKPVIVAGTLGFQRARALLGTAAEFAREIYLVRPKQPRACSFEELEAAIPKDFQGPVKRAKLEELFPGPGRTLLGETGETIVVTGSIYLIGEVVEAMECATPIGEGVLQD